MLKRKSFWLLGVLCALLLSVLCFGGCAIAARFVPHIHIHTEWETTKEPTCIASGKKERHCRICGYIQREIVVAKGHTEKVIFGTTATCQQEGMTDGINCSACNKIIIEQKAIEKTGHIYGLPEVVSPKKCTGWTMKYTCTNCPHFYYLVRHPEFTPKELLAQASEYTGVLRVYDELDNITQTESCVVISEDGKLLTSYSAVKGAYFVAVLIKNIPYEVDRILAVDERADVAILQIAKSNMPKGGLQAADVCSEPMQANDAVYAIGANDSGGHTLTQGRVLSTIIDENAADYITHDITIDAAYSGGPLINRFGEVIGFNTRNTPYIMGYSAAVFASILDELQYKDVSGYSIKELYEHNKTETGKLRNWLCFNYNKLTEKRMELEYIYMGSAYRLGYDSVSNSVYLQMKVAYETEGVSTVLTLKLSDGNTHGYTVEHSRGELSYDTVGKVDALSFSTTRQLVYDSFVGDGIDKTEMMKHYSELMSDLLVKFDWMKYTYDIDTDISKFGFSGFEGAKG